MEKNLTKNTLLILVCAIFVLSCANKKPKPETASSADSAGYAAGYPASLNTALTTYTEQTAKAKENDTAFAGYSAAAGEADPAVLRAVYLEADKTGRGQAYADKTEEVRAVRAFFDREKEDISRRINGSVQAAKEKASCSCELDTYGAVSYALKDGVDKRLEKSLQETGEQHLLIERNEKALGKKNVETVATQADTIAWTAHVVFVSLPTLYEDMSRMASESKKVKKTLEAAIADERVREADASLSKAEKKESKKRIQALEDAKNAVDVFVSEAERLVLKAETEIPAVRAEYEKAFDNLIDVLAAQQK